MLPGTHFYSWNSYSKNSKFIPGITVIPGIIYSSFQEPAPGLRIKLSGFKSWMGSLCCVLRKIISLIAPLTHKYKWVLVNLIAGSIPGMV